MITVLDLAEQDTRLHRESVRENAGPCPDIHCRCQTNGFRVKWNGEKWVFMCRGCWDSEEYLSDKDRKRGWGDEIDYLRHYRKMSFKQAKMFLSEQGNETDRAVTREPVLGLNYLSDHWQAQTRDDMMECKASLWGDDTTALDYARHRGLEDPTIKKARLGYSLTDGIPRLLIPSINEKRYVAIHRRDLRLDIPPGERWKDARGGTKSELYLADSLKRKMPTVLCEDALSALSVVQEAGGLVNVVATCGADCGQQVKWLARLARMPLVLISLDADAAGDDNAKWWLDRLPNARRLRPLLKDINDMLMQGWDIRDWIESAVSVLSAPQSVVQIFEQPPKPTGFNQFIGAVDRIGLEVFGPGCTITIIPKGYTLDQRIADLGLKVKPLGMTCAICRYNRAVVLGNEGKPYCQQCRDADRRIAV